MADKTKTLNAQEIEKRVRERFFGSKTRMPGNANNEEERSKEQLAYSQMIMGTLASLVWGEKSVKTSDKAKSLLGRSNIFELVKSIKDNIDAIKTEVINKGTNSNNTSTSVKSNTEKQQIELILNGNENTLKSLETLNTVIKELQDLSIINKDVGTGFESYLALINTDASIFDKKLESNINLLDNFFTKLDEFKNVNENIIYLDIKYQSLSDIIKDIEDKIDIIFSENLVQKIIDDINNKFNEADPIAINIDNQIANKINSFVESLQINPDDLKQTQLAIDSLETILNSLESAVSFDHKKINNNLTELNSLFAEGSDVSDNFSKLFKNISGIINKGNIEEIAKDITGLNSMLQTIITVISLDPKIINLKGLRILEKITDTNFGLIAKLLRNLEELTTGDNGVTINNKNFIAIKDFFEAMSEIGNIGLYKRALIKANIKYFTEFIGKEIPKLLIEISKSADKTFSNENVKSIIALQSIFESLAKIGELDFKRKIRMKLNLMYIRHFIIRDVVSILNEIIESITKATEDSSKTIDSFIKLLDKILDIGKISFTRFILLSLKLDLLEDIIEDQIIGGDDGGILGLINSIQDIESAKNNMSQLEEVFDTINNIIDSDTSLKDIILFSFKVGSIESFIRVIKRIVKNLNSIDRATISSALSSTEKLIDLFEKTKIIVELISSINISLINAYKLLKVVKKESEIIEETKNLINILNSIQYDDDKVKKILDVIKTLSEIKSNFVSAKLYQNTLKVILSSVDIIKDICKKIKDDIKQDDIENAKKVLGSFNTFIFKAAAILLLGSIIMGVINWKNLLAFTVALSGFLFVLSKTFTNIAKSLKEDIKTADEAIKLIAASGLILLLGSYIMELIDERNLIIFTLILSGFLLTLSWVFETIAKTLKEDTKTVNDIIKLVAAAGFVLLLGSYLTKLLEPQNLIIFTVSLGVFLFGITYVFNKISKNLEDSTKAAKKAIIVIGLATAIMALGSLAVKLFTWQDTLLFITELGIFLAGIYFAFKFFNGKRFNKAYDGTKNALLIVGMATAIMVLGSLATHFFTWKDALLFIVELGVFLTGIYALFKFYSGKRFDKGYKGAKQALLIVGMATAIMVLGSLATHFFTWKDALLFITELGVFLTGLYFLFSKYSGRKLNKSFKGAKKALLIVGAATLILIAGATANRYYSFKDAIGFVIELGSFLIALGVLFWGTGKLFKSGIKRARKLVGIVVAASLIMVIGQLLYDYLDGEKIFGFVAILGGFVIALGVVFWIAGKLMKKAFIGMALMILVTTAAGLVLLIAGKIVEDNPGLLWNALLFGGTIALYVAVMGVVCGLLGMFAPEIGLGLLVMLGIGVLTVLAIAVMQIMYAISKQPEFFDTILEGLKSMGAVFGSFIGAISALGLVALGGGWAVFLAGGGVLLEIEGLVYLAAKVLIAIANAMNILKSVDVNDTAFDNMKKVITNFGDLVLLLIEKIPINPLKLAKLPIALKTAKETSIAVSYMAKAVKEFATLKIPTQFDAQGNATAWITIGNKEFDTAQENIGKVITCIFKGIMDVANDPKNKDLFTDNFFTDSPAMNAAKVAKQMGVAIASIAKGIKEFADLKIATKFNSKGEPIAFKSLVSKDFDTAQENIGKVITCISDALLGIAKEKPELFDDSFFTDSPAMNAAKVAKKMGDAIGSIATGIKQWVDLRIVTKYNSKGEPIEYKSLVDDDFTKAGEHIKAVLVCIGESLTKTVEDNPKLFADAFGSDSPAMNAAKSMKVMGDVLNDTAMAIAGYSSGEFPLFDKDGKLLPRDQWVHVDFSQLGPGGSVEQAINTVLTCIGTALKEVVDGNPEIFDDGLFSKSKAAVAATALKDMSEAINNAVDAIVKLSELKTEDLETKINTVKENLKKAIIAMLGIFDVFSNPTVGTENGVQKEAVKGGLKGFINGVAKVFGGEGKVFETNGSIAEYINNNIDDVEDAVKAINEFQKIISNLLSTVSNLVKSYDDNKKHINSFITTGDGKLDLSSIIAQSINNVKAIYKSVVNATEGTTIDEELSNTNKLNELVRVYITILNDLVKLSEFANEIGEDGYNVLRDGILKIYGATSSIDNIINFNNHTNDLERYIDAINRIELGKLSQLQGFVDSMNELSRRLGNLDNLTDAIANRLSSVLYELVKQLRLADNSINNAHKLQEYRKKLIEESVEKVKKLMDNPMIVEISQKTEDESTQTTSTGSIDGVPTESSTKSEDTSPKNEGLDLGNPENGQDNKMKFSPQYNPQNNNDVLTKSQFEELMRRNMKGWGEN